MPTRLELKFADAAALRAEYEANLRRGRAFVPGETGWPVLEGCQLAILLPDHGAVILAARVVMPADLQLQMGGVGLSLEPGHVAVLEGLLADLEAAATPAGAASADDSAQDLNDGPADASDSDSGDELEDASEGESEGDWETELAAAELAEAQGGVSSEFADSPVLRLSRLSMPEKLKRIRRSQILAERNLLERMLGKAGWEALLQNARLTIPEVAKLARKGTMPKPLLERIVDNKAWVAAAPVRRALLQNPKLPRMAIANVLRTVPRRELELMMRGAAYPSAVREVIRRMLEV